MNRFCCLDCAGQRFRLGVQSNGLIHNFYIRCANCGFTLNFFPVPFCFEPDEPDKVILADTDFS